MISDCIRIELAELDTSITSRITERDVMMWLAVRLEQVRKELPRLSCMEVEVWHWDHCRDEHMTGGISVSGYNAVSGKQASLQQAMVELRLSIAKDPEKQAVKLRHRASRLNDKANDLLAVAQALKEKPIPGAEEGGAK